MRGFHAASWDSMQLRPQSSITPTLMTVIGMGLKDPFSPCRCAALQTSEAENGWPLKWCTKIVPWSQVLVRSNRYLAFESEEKTGYGPESAKAL